MASYKKKEEERIERALRALLKLAENRRCINCNSLGPQYVCITFLTFVCTNCSGIHREFTHRVKSVSIARFCAEEVAALEAAGNGRARQIYFKEFDPLRHSFPDSSNLHKLREFIRQVYMERRFSGESHKLQRLKLSDEEPYQPRKLSSCNGRSRGPLYEDNFDPRPAGRGDPRSFKHLFRSPSTGRDPLRSGGRKSSAFFEIVDNRVRSGRPRRHDGVGSGQGSRSPELQRNVHRSCSPVVVHPAGDSDERQKEQGGDAGNLIDFSMEPETENATSAQHMSGSNTIEKACSITNVHSLEDLLFGLSVTPTAAAGVVADGSTGSNEHVQQQPPASSVSVSLPNTEQQQPFASPLAQQAIPSVPPSQNQPNAQAPSTGSTEQEPGAFAKPSQDAISGSSGDLPSLPSEVKTIARTEIPLDLFANFPDPASNWQIGPTHGMECTFPQPAPNWQISPSHAMGYNSPYYQNPQCSARSTNPFDINDEAPESQPTQFPSMMTPPSNSFESPRPQGISGIGHGGEAQADPFASLMVNPKSTGSSIPSKGGNPFG